MGFDGLVQLISVDGQRTVGCPYWDLVADVDASQLRDLYRDMAVVRRLDAEAMALQRQGELALWAPLLGQEAAQVGSARALRPDDFVFPSYREHGVAYCRGVDPVAMLRLWRGTGLSGWDPADFGIATPAIIVGSQALHATGYALGITLDGAAPPRSPTSVTAPRARVTSPRPSASPPATRSPWSSSARTTSGRSPSRCACSRTRPSHSGARATASPGSRWTATTSWPSSPPRGWRSPAPTPARGPTLIEAVTYRMGPHTTSDDPTRYRTRAEEEEWRARTPWRACGHCCAPRAWPTSEFEDTVDAAARAAAAELRRGCLAMHDPEPAALFDHVYAEPHPLLDEERAAYAAYLAGFDEEP